MRVRRRRSRRRRSSSEARGRARKRRAELQRQDAEAASERDSGSFGVTLVPVPRSARKVPPAAPQVAAAGGPRQTPPAQNRRRRPATVDGPPAAADRGPAAPSGCAASSAQPAQPSPPLSPPAELPAGREAAGTAGGAAGTTWCPKAKQPARPRRDHRLPPPPPGLSRGDAGEGAVAPSSAVTLERGPSRRRWRGGRPGRRGDGDGPPAGGLGAHAPPAPRSDVLGRARHPASARRLGRVRAGRRDAAAGAATCFGTGAAIWLVSLVARRSAPAGRSAAARAWSVRLLGRGLGSGQDCRGLRQSQAFRKPFASWRVADEWLKEAFPVRGSWADEWCPQTAPALQHEALAAPQGQFSSMPSQASSTAFLGISPADAVTTQDAIWFLRREEAAWYGRFHPCGPLRTDITGGVSASSQRQLHWPDFVQGREWYRQRFLWEFSITAFEVARAQPRHFQSSRAVCAGSGARENTFAGCGGSGHQHCRNAICAHILP